MIKTKLQFKLFLVLSLCFLVSAWASAYASFLLEKGEKIDKSAISSARRSLEKYTKDDNPLMARYYQCKVLGHEQKFPQCLECFLELFESGRDTPFDGVRLSFMLGDFKDLADAHPPALDALQKLIEERKTRLYGGTASYMDAMEWVRLLGHIYDHEDEPVIKEVRLFRDSAPENEKREETWLNITDILFEMLYKHKCYTELEAISLWYYWALIAGDDLDKWDLYEKAPMAAGVLMALDKEHYYRRLADKLVARNFEYQAGAAVQLVMEARRQNKPEMEKYVAALALKELSPEQFKEFEIGLR